MKTLITLAIAALTTQMAQAETWLGSGEIYSLAGEKQSEYQLQVENELRDGKSFSTVTITIEGRELVVSRCSNEYQGTSWATTCEEGLRGGGSCYGEGLCQSYLEKNARESFATTIVFDGDRSMRLLRTELRDGEAVRIFSEKLTKQAQ